jgi:hypothetical protein
VSSLSYWHGCQQDDTRLMALSLRPWLFPPFPLLCL